MKEKTRIGITIASIFAVAMIVIAFGNFIESQKNSDLIPIGEGKAIQLNENNAGKLELKDETIIKENKTEIKKDETATEEDEIKKQIKSDAINFSGTKLN